MCAHAITSNNKNKFLMTCFTSFSGTFSMSFSCEIKLHMKNAQKAGISLETFIFLTRQKPLMGAMANVGQLNSLTFVWVEL